ncbi:MAG TPA: HAD-IB family hydrolase [Desertimonas sp.]|nr:HAD-IB family hydrolase [Desertimonas sp.]
MPDVPLVAAFDVDGTLTTRDCVVPFLRRVAGTTGLVTGLARRSHQVLPAAVGRDRDRLKELATRVVFAGRRADEVDEVGRRFAVHIAASWLRDDRVATLRRHLEDGHHVVLVSASYEAYLVPLAAQLGDVGVIGTRLGVAADGSCTGELDGGNCRGTAKVVHLHRWLGERFGGRRNVTLWAYGDSAGDEAMLADADHGVWVGR